MPRKFILIEQFGLLECFRLALADFVFTFLFSFTVLGQCKDIIIVRFFGAVGIGCRLDFLDRVRTLRCTGVKRLQSLTFLFLCALEEMFDLIA